MILTIVLIVFFVTIIYILSKIPEPMNDFYYEIYKAELKELKEKINATETKWRKLNEKVCNEQKDLEKQLNLIHSTLINQFTQLKEVIKIIKRVKNEV